MYQFMVFKRAAQCVQLTVGFASIIKHFAKRGLGFFLLLHIVYTRPLPLTLAVGAVCLHEKNYYEN